MKLRPYQTDGVSALVQYFIDGNTGNPIAVYPTASGKSVIIAELVKYIMSYPNQKVLMLTHRKELIAQNYEKLITVWPTAPAGIYSAGLGKREAMNPITFAGIASVSGKHALFGRIDIVLIDECFSNDTEVLTENGFVRFDELSSEKVAQYDVKSAQISFAEPLRYIKKKPSSKVLRVFSENNFDLLLTENHEMLVKNETNDSFKKIIVKDITQANYNKIPVSGFGIGCEKSLSAFEKLIIAFQADGNAHRTNTDGSGILAFSFSKQRKINAFVNLMHEGSFSWKEVSGKDDRRDNVKPRRRFMVYIGKMLSKDITRYFNIKNLSSEKCSEIIEYMSIWDGHVASKNSYLYTNTDKKATDFYQAVAVLSGNRTKLSKVIDERSDKFSDVYRLSIVKNTEFSSTQNFNREEVEYEGDVYCVEMPLGTVIVRRGGKVAVTGNCHLVSVNDETMYRTVINELKAVNPYLKVIGFTATPWRIGQGKLTDEGGLFTDIAIDYSSLDKFNWLISEGYLSPLIPNRTTLNIDTENLHIRSGEFITSEVQKAVDKNEITIAALKETLEVASERKCGMIFGAGIEHCEHIEAALKAMGQSCCVVHSKQDNKINDQYIADFKAGKIRWLINNDKLTTGFDCPQVDVIVVLRPTASIILWVQMLGRGCRVVYAPGFDLETKEGRLAAIASGPKQNCLVLDFANNTRRLGPINDPVIPRKRGKGGGTAPIKECMYCPTINHASARFCIACGEEFLFQTKIVEQSSAEELIKGEIPIIETFNVSHVTYRINIGVRGKAPTLLVSYHCGYSLYKEYICLEHEKPAVKAKARSWWRESGGQVPEPATVEEAVLRKGELSAPKSIRVWVNKQYPEILARFFT